MKIVKCKGNQVEMEKELKEEKKETIIVNRFYKGQFDYTIAIVKDTNIIEVTKEDIKSEFFEIEYFEIKN